VCTAKGWNACGEAGWCKPDCSKNGTCTVNTPFDIFTYAENCGAVIQNTIDSQGILCTQDSDCRSPSAPYCRKGCPVGFAALYCETENYCSPTR
jgi:hypothetical protein